MWLWPVSPACVELLTAGNTQPPLHHSLSEMAAPAWPWLCCIESSLLAEITQVVTLVGRLSYYTEKSNNIQHCRKYLETPKGEKVLFEDKHCGNVLIKLHFILKVQLETVSVLIRRRLRDKLSSCTATQQDKKMYTHITIYYNIFTFIKRYFQTF